MIDRNVYCDLSQTNLKLFYLIGNGACLLISDIIVEAGETRFNALIAD